MNLTEAIATFGGAGRLKPGPGTWGSAAALALAVPLDVLGGRPALALAAFGAFAVGLWASGCYARAEGRDDPSEVVIDEVAGLWFVFAIIPMTWGTAVAGFALFRLFDIAKPWPISWANDRIPGAFGIMVDDLMAGAAAAGVLWAGLRGLAELSAT